MPNYLGIVLPIRCYIRTLFISDSGVFAVLCSSLAPWSALELARRIQRHRRAERHGGDLASRGKNLASHGVSGVTRAKHAKGSGNFAATAGLLRPDIGGALPCLAVEGRVDDLQHPHLCSLLAHALG